MRKQTGLRNRFRDGRSTYSVKGKNLKADRYGDWNQGTQTRSEVVAGRTLTYDVRKQTWNGVGRRVTNNSLSWYLKELESMG